MEKELITVATYCFAWEAQLARNLLQEDGILAFLINENSAVTGWNALVEVKVRVATADAERARQLLWEAPS